MGRLHLDARKGVLSSIGSCMGYAPLYVDTCAAIAAGMRRDSLFSALLSFTVILEHVSSINRSRFCLMPTYFELDAPIWSRLIVMALLYSRAARTLGAMVSL